VIVPLDVRGKLLGHRQSAPENGSEPSQCR
jgi:hypothetical protein